MFVASVAADPTLPVALAPLKLGDAIYCIQAIKQQNSLTPLLKQNRSRLGRAGEGTDRDWGEEDEVGSKEIKQQLATNSRRRGDRDWGRPEGDRITHRSWIQVAGAVLVAGEQGRVLVTGGRRADVTGSRRHRAGYGAMRECGAMLARATGICDMLFGLGRIHETVIRRIQQP